MAVARRYAQFVGVRCDHNARLRVRGSTEGAGAKKNKPTIARNVWRQPDQAANHIVHPDG